MLYIIFCYAADTAMLRMVTERIRTLDADARIYAISDPAAPVDPAAVPGIEHRRGSVPRGGNLNGLPIIAEELSTFRSLMDAEGVPELIKIDADCYPLSFGALVLPPKPAELTICERWQPFTPAGMVYHLTRRMVDALQAEFNRRTELNLWQSGYHWPEDITIWNLATLTGLPVQMLPYAGGYACGMPDCLPDELPDKVRNSDFVHCGEPLPDGTRVSREHATLRMRILHAATTASEKAEAESEP